MSSQTSTCMYTHKCKQVKTNLHTNEMNTLAYFLHKELNIGLISDTKEIHLEYFSELIKI